MKAHEQKSLIDDAVSLLGDACDTDDVLWAARMTGQDSEEAESSGYLVGYRDALTAIQQLLYHDSTEPLAGYLDSVRDDMHEAQQEVEELDPDEVHFWSAT